MTKPLSFEENSVKLLKVVALKGRGFSRAISSLLLIRL